MEVCEKCSGTGRVTYTLPRPEGEPNEFSAYCECAKAKEVMAQDHPPQYPVCSADPPHAPGDPCGWENCNLHNILWMEGDGCTHEQAVGLTAVYNFSESMGYGPVADALGGMEEFNALNENGVDVPGMVAWYDQHQPLVYYIMETNEQTGLWDYWWQAKHPTHPIPERGTISMWLVKGPEGQWLPYQTPGFPVVFPEDFTGWSDHYDATKASMDPELWANHVVAHFEYKRPFQWNKLSS